MAEKKPKTPKPSSPFLSGAKPVGFYQELTPASGTFDAHYGHEFSGAEVSSAVGGHYVVDKESIANIHYPKGSTWDFAFFTPADREKIPESIVKMDNANFAKGVLHKLPYQPDTFTNKIKYVLAARESGQGILGRANYYEGGPAVKGTDDRANGFLQAMTPNIDTWARELGPQMYQNLLKGLGSQSVTRTQFASNPRLQELILTNHIDVLHKMGQSAERIVHGWIGWGVSDGYITSEKYTQLAMADFRKLGGETQLAMNAPAKATHSFVEAVEDLSTKVFHSQPQTKTSATLQPPPRKNRAALRTMTHTAHAHDKLHNIAQKNAAPKNPATASRPDPIGNMIRSWLPTSRSGPSPT